MAPDLSKYLTAACIFECETTKMKLAKKQIFMQQLFLCNVIFLQILMLYTFFKIPYVLL